MPRRSYSLVLLAALWPAAGWAQDAPAPDGLGLELNLAVTTEQGACELTFLAENGTAAAIEDVTYSMAFFGPDGQFDRLLQLGFGALRADRSKITQFVVDRLACDAIAQILPNDAVACVVAGEPSPVCMDALAPRSRVDGIVFEY